MKGRWTTFIKCVWHDLCLEIMPFRLHKKIINSCKKFHNIARVFVFISLNEIGVHVLGSLVWGQKVPQTDFTHVLVVESCLLWKWQQFYSITLLISDNEWSVQPSFCAVSKPNEIFWLEDLLVMTSSNKISCLLYRKWHQKATISSSILCLV